MNISQIVVYLIDAIREGGMLGMFRLSFLLLVLVLSSCANINKKANDTNSELHIENAQNTKQNESKISQKSEESALVEPNAVMVEIIEREEEYPEIAMSETVISDATPAQEPQSSTASSDVFVEASESAEVVAQSETVQVSELEEKASPTSAELNGNEVPKAEDIKFASDDDPANREGYALIKTFYGTDRKYTGQEFPEQVYEAERGQVNYGAVTVSIPENHEIGEIERPHWLIAWIRDADPEKHFTTRSIDRMEREEFLAAIANERKDAAFIFVHGYNVGFQDAAWRTAQIAYDLNIATTPIFYSWPSKGATAAYTFDEQSAEWTQSNVQKFLVDVAESLPEKKLYLIAHSMGNRPVTRALVNITRDRPELRKRFTEVVLAAPDIDADVFRRDIAPKIKVNGQPVTLYVSDKDKALLASNTVHNYHRIGDARNGIVPIDGFEIIDASNVKTDFLSHSYIGDAKSILIDLYYMFKEGVRAANRFGVSKIETENGRYYKLIDQ